MPEIEVDPEHLASIAALLFRHVPEREVWAFGSRVPGPAKKFSDLDLAILGDAPVPMEVMAALAEEFEESNLPFQVDLVDWAGTSESFREVIRKNHAVVQRPADSRPDSVAAG